ncbi:hypothetical protein Nit79A3_0487 [Nitrosomonas sp. Is79A3]
MPGMLDVVKEVAEKIRLHEGSAKQSALNAQRHEKKAEISKEKKKKRKRKRKDKLIS